MEWIYGLLLLAPLLLAACGMAVFGYRRVTMKNNKFELTAANPFPERKAWAQAERDRLRLMHSVKQVKAQRELALGSLEDAAEEGRMVVMEMPDFTGKMIMDRGSLVLAVQDKAKALEDTDAAALALPGQISGTKLDLVKAKTGIMSKVGGTFGGGGQQPAVVEVRRIQDSQAEDGRAQLQRGRTGGELWRGMADDGGPQRSIGPESPTTSMLRDWNPERDGPMPPDLSFPHSSNPQRRDFLLRVLDWE
jgi:hypothetical protein